MQNHLLQILVLFALETPVSLDVEDIRNEKVKVLRSMRPIKLEDVVLGQYKNHTRGGVAYPAYIDDKTVPKDSLTQTFAAAAHFIDNARWDGVPFLMKAGKALHTKRFTDKQIMRLQETPDEIPEGGTPHTVSLLLHDKLVDTGKPGDRVEVTGIYRAMNVKVGPTQRTVKSLFKESLYDKYIDEHGVVDFG